MEDVKTTISELNDLGLSTLGDEYQQYLAEQNKQVLEELWAQTIVPAYIQKLTLDDVLKLPFDLANKYIKQFSMSQRIDMLEELTKYKNHLYNEANRYGDDRLDKETQISANTFRVLLGKIKHLEIIQNWLYGID